MTGEHGRVVIVEESRWRRAWPWIALALVSPLLISGPFLPVFAVWGGTGLAVWTLQQRRTRTSLFIENNEVVVTNPYSTHRVPIEGASIEVGDRLFGPAMGRDVLAENTASNVGSKALYVVPSGDDPERIVVSVALGISQSEFERVVTELQAQLDKGR